MSKYCRKNVSSKIRNGTILQTRDEYFAGQKQYRKPGYANKGNYRKSVVIDSNRNDELAVVKLYSKSGKELIETKSKYKPFVEVFDDNNKRIRVGRKFIPNGDYLSQQNVAKIKKDCFTSPKIKYINKKKIRNFKGRK